MHYSEAFYKYHKDMMEEIPETADEVNFVLDDVLPTTKSLSLEDRLLTNLAVLLGCQGKDEFKSILKMALDLGLTPDKIREVILQAIAYLGMGRVRPFIQIFAKEMKKRDIHLPLHLNPITDRLVDGNDKQVELFGAHMKESWNGAPSVRKNIMQYLAENCFGDYYTRGILDNRERELITFCYIYAQGGADSQATSHALANMKNGNSKEYLYTVLNANVCFVGYPRTLNGMSCVDAADKTFSAK